MKRTVVAILTAGLLAGLSAKEQELLASLLKKLLLGYESEHPAAEEAEAARFSR